MFGVGGTIVRIKADVIYSAVRYTIVAMSRTDSNFRDWRATPVCPL